MKESSKKEVKVLYTIAYIETWMRELEGLKDSLTFKVLLSCHDYKTITYVEKRVIWKECKESGRVEEIFKEGSESFTYYRLNWNVNERGGRS